MSRLQLMIIFLVLAQSVFAQPRLEQWLEEGLSAYERGNYNAAAQYYEVAATQYETSEPEKLWFRNAHALRQMHHFREAAVAYQRAIDQGVEQHAAEALQHQRFFDYPHAKFWLAVALQNTAQYDAAESLFSQFHQEPPEEALNHFIELARIYAESCRWSKSGALQKTCQAPVNATTINSNNRAEFGISIAHLSSLKEPPHGDFVALGDTVYLDRSSGFDADTLVLPYKIVQDTGMANPDTLFQNDTTIYQYYHSTFRSEYTEECRDPVLSSQIVSGGKPLSMPKMQGAGNISNPAFSPDGQVMFFTLCTYIENGNEERCDLYRSQRLTSGKWSAPEKLDCNADAPFTSTQPSVGWEARSGKAFLYFASDRNDQSTKRERQMDLFRCPLDDQYRLAGTAESLNGINTPWNECTPFFDSREGILYFSTDGRKTLGGFDIYRSLQTESGWTEPEHLGAGFNTSYDDLYYCIHPNRRQAFLTSNRIPQDVTPAEEEECRNCYDIFSIDLPPTQLIVATNDAWDRDTLNYCNIQVREIRQNQQEVLLRTVVNRSDNRLAHTLPEGKYRINASYLKEGEYCSAERTIDIQRPTPACLPQTLKDSLFLQPILELTVYTLESSPTQGESSLDSVTVDYYQTSLTARGAGTADLATPPVAEKLTASKEHNYVDFCMKRETPYRIVGSKPGFFPDDEDLPEYTLEAYKRSGRRKQFIDTLRLSQPGRINLYFDNDIPKPLNGPGTPGYTQTGQNFQTLNATYVDRKEVYSSNTSGDIRDKILFLFENEIGSASDNLESLMPRIHDNLRKGFHVKIKLEGSCSKLGDSLYNVKLSERRIDAVINSFEAYQVNGSRPFLTYLDSDPNNDPGAGKLVFQTSATGFSKARDLGDEKVFNDLAMEDRVVQLTVQTIRPPDLAPLGNNENLCGCKKR